MLILKTTLTKFITYFMFSFFSVIFLFYNTSHAVIMQRIQANTLWTNTQNIGVNIGWLGGGYVKNTLLGLYAQTQEQESGLIGYHVGFMAGHSIVNKTFLRGIFNNTFLRGYMLYEGAYNHESQLGRLTIGGNTYYKKWQGTINGYIPLFSTTHLLDTNQAIIRQGKVARQDIKYEFVQTYGDINMGKQFDFGSKGGSWIPNIGVYVLQGGGGGYVGNKLRIPAMKLSKTVSFGLQFLGKIGYDTANQFNLGLSFGFIILSQHSQSSYGMNAINTMPFITNTQNVDTDITPGGEDGTGDGNGDGGGGDGGGDDDGDGNAFVPGNLSGPRGNAIATVNTLDELYKALNDPKIGTIIFGKDLSLTQPIVFPNNLQLCATTCTVKFKGKNYDAIIEAAGKRTIAAQEGSNMFVLTGKTTVEGLKFDSYKSRAILTMAQTYGTDNSTITLKNNEFRNTTIFIATGQKLKTLTIKMIDNLFHYQDGYGFSPSFPQLTTSTITLRNDPYAGGTLTYTGSGNTMVVDGNHNYSGPVLEISSDLITNGWILDSAEYNNNISSTSFPVWVYNGLSGRNIQAIKTLTISNSHAYVYNSDAIPGSNVLTNVFFDTVTVNGNSFIIGSFVSPQVTMNIVHLTVDLNASTNTITFRGSTVVAELTLTKGMLSTDAYTATTHIIHLTTPEAFIFGNMGRPIYFGKYGSSIPSITITGQTTANFFSTANFIQVTDHTIMLLSTADTNNKLKIGATNVTFSNIPAGVANKFQECHLGSTVPCP